MAYFDGSKSSKGWYARLEYSYTQSSSATTISLTLKVYDATGSSYNNNNNSAYYVIQGDKTYQKYSFGSAGWYTIGSKTVTVTNTSATSLYVSAQWVSDNETTYTPASLSVSGTITFPRIEPPAPTVNTITTSSIPDFIAEYDGNSASLKTTPSGGTGYSYKWYKNGSVVGTSQTYSWSLSNSNDDNKEVYCVVTDSTGGEATTNKCQLRVGTAESLVEITTHQVQPVKLYNGTKFLNGIPFIKTSDGLMYCNWTITRENTNVAGLAIAGKAIVG